MSMPVSLMKAQWRRQIRSEARKSDPAAASVLGLKAVEILLGRPEWKRASSVLLFAPLPDEVNIWPLAERTLESGKALYLPAYHASDGVFVIRRLTRPDPELVEGYQGIREPSAACPVLAMNRLDFILVPGLAFDLHGYRLGRGKGYYDRILAGLGGLTCGAAFDNRVVEALPFEPHDIRVNCILTPTRWIECGRHRSAAE